MYVLEKEVPIIEIIRKYKGDVPITEEVAGPKIVCPIPGHDETSPSFKIYEETNTFHCFGCKKSGTPVDLVRMILGLYSNQEALLRIRQDFDIDENAVPNLLTLCKLKNLEPSVVEELGWHDVAAGVKIPYKGLLPEQQGVEGVTYKIRTRYSGTPKYIKDGKNIQIPYGLELLSGYDKSVLYLTEGETDMVTLYQAGYPALGIPGANSYTSQMADYIKEFKTICVCLDSDKAGSLFLDEVMKHSTGVYYKEMPYGIKDVNSLHTGSIERFKGDFESLPLIPASIEGFELLAKQGVNILDTNVIVSFAKRRLSKDKVAQDMFVSTLHKLQGKEKGVTISTLKGLLKEATSTTNADVELSSPRFIIEGEKGYDYKRLVNGEPVFEQLTNFKVKVMRVEMQEDGSTVGLWRLTTDEGISIDVGIGARERASQFAFMEAISKINGILYTAPNITGFHSRFIHYIETKDIAAPAFNPQRVGYYKGRWLFNNMGIDTDGKVVLPSMTGGTYMLKGGTFLTPDEQFQGELRLAVPEFPTEGNVSKVEMKELLTLLEQNQGCGIGWVLLGWLGATFFKERIQEGTEGFPVCYVTGNSQSGKSLLANNLTYLVGNNGRSAVGASSSAFGINYIMSIMGSLPLWFDDIRNLGEEGIWNTLFLSLYSNTADYKGTKDRKLAATFNFNASCLITSEFTMRSPAAVSRCCLLEVDPRTQDRSLGTDTEKACIDILPRLGLRLLKNAHKVDIVKIVKEQKEVLKKQGVKDRMAHNYACIVAGFICLTEGLIQADTMETFMGYIGQTVGHDMLEMEESTYAMEIINDMIGILQDPAYKGSFARGTNWIVRDNVWHIMTDTLYDTWRRYKGVHNLDVTRQTFIAQLRRLPFAVGNKQGVIKLEGKSRRAVSWDLEEMKKSPSQGLQILPDLLEELDVSELV